MPFSIMCTSDSVKAKISKLLRMQQSDNPGEAANAAAFVEKLCKEHGISPDECSPDMASTYITKDQRKILIDSYIECADEMGLDDLDETQARLEKLSNPKLIEECVAFMPDCLEEI